MKLAVIGTGYVGLVAGAGFADFGNDVVCVDIDYDRVERLRRGEIPIHEPGLDELVHRCAKDGRLQFSGDLPEAVKNADVVLIAVGTPSRPDGSADLSQVLSAASEIGRALTGEAVIVTKSTVPVGTADRLREALSAVTPHPFAVASNPEFLKEGTAVENFLRPDRVVVGVGQPGQPLSQAETRAAIRLRHLYEPVLRTSDRLLLTDTRSAEMTKYASNAYLATRISFVNDIAALCEKTGADVDAVRRGMGMDPRIGPQFLYPGMGYGGSCFPKDVQALLVTGWAHGMEMRIVRAAHAINERQKTVLFDKILRHFGAQPTAVPHGAVTYGCDDAGRVQFDVSVEMRIAVEQESGLPLHGRTIAVWGLAFKPETDDVREAPALALVERLLQAGARVRVTDPVALDNARWHFIHEGSSGRRISPLTFHADPLETARGADALVLATEWRPYRQPSFRRLRELMPGDGIFDGRNVWDPAEVREAGFTYYGIGRSQ